MTTNDRFEPAIAAWLHDEARHRVPEHLGEVLAVTAKTRQRPAWSSLERWLPMDLTMATRRVPVTPPRRLILALALLALAALLAVAIAGSRAHVPPPFGLAANGSILLSKDGDIYAADAGGGNVRLLVGGDSDDEGPWFSHDGTHFVFWRQTAPTKAVIMMANPDGSNVHPIIDTPLLNADWYEWSPADDRIAVVHENRGLRVLSIVDVATGKVRDLNVGDLNVDNNVLWRPPNGDELIFSARANATSGRGVSLFGIRADGTGLRTIAAKPNVDWPFLGIDLAPDGQTLTYWMYESVAGAADPHARIHLVNLGTGKDRVARFDPGAVEESELRFSPDGTTGTIVEAGTKATLAVVDLASESLVRHIGPEFVGNEDKAVAFSPDGKTALLAFDGGHPNLIDIASGDVHIVDAFTGSYSSWQRLAR
jgi:Tol biopolymer transport system component